MNVRFYIDPDSELPHIYGHNVNEEEVRDILETPGEDRAGRDDSRVAIGRTRSGRYLRVVYVPDLEPDSVFVITAYDLTQRQIRAYKRRMRKRKK